MADNLTPSALDAVRKENLLDAIGMLQYLADHKEDHPGLDREIFVAERFIKVMRGEESLESIVERIKQQNDEWRRTHPISTWLYDHLPSWLTS